MTQPPQIDVNYLAKAYASALPATIEQYVMDCRLAKSDAEHWACQEITTLRAEKQALVDRVFELEEFAENVRHESCQTLAGKDT